jgi:flagellar basal-body rod protein FlgG
MIRALYTAATGLEAQQLNIDVIANNLANVSTSGFKKSRADFQDLLYQTSREPGGPATSTTQSSTGIQVGLGVRPAAVQRINAQGDFNQTSNPLDVAVSGDGYFQVTLPDGSTAFTRAGAFKLDSTGSVVTSSGDPLSPQINIPDGSESIAIGDDGTVSVTLAGQSAPARSDSSRPRASPTRRACAPGRQPLHGDRRSGPPQLRTPGQDGPGQLTQGFLEGSNVSVVEGWSP